jgi:hypothetical protein
MLNDTETRALYKPVEKDEMKKVLSNFKEDKSSGSDGWTVDFFSHLFDLVGEDLLEMVEESRLNGFIPRAVNSTFITLIPKVNKPQNFREYRPIVRSLLKHTLRDVIYSFSHSPLNMKRRRWVGSVFSLVNRF